MRALARTVAEGRSGTLRLCLGRVAPVAGAAALALALPASAGAHHHHRRATLSISSASVREPDGSATTKAVFDVKLSHKKHHVVKASYKTVAGSAGASDFRAKSGVVKLKPGSRRAHIKVVVLGDNQHEGDETFSVKLSHSVRAHMKRRTGVATIVDNDPAGGGGGGGGGNHNPPDADDDGIPDSLDACPHDYDPDGYCPVPVYDVNDGTVGPGAKARVKNLMVTAIDRPDKLVWAQAQPGDDGYKGVKNSALRLADQSSLPGTLAIGDRVNVTGSTASDEFDVISLNDTSSGGTPAVASLTPGDVGNPKYDAVLGSVDGETLTTAAAHHWTMFDGLNVPDQIIGTLPVRSAGAYFSTVTGIFAGTDVSPTLMPRIAGDIQDGTAPPRTVAKVHITDDCVNDNETHAAVATVQLSGPASDPTSVTMSASSPASLTFDPVTVVPGADTAVVRVSGASPANDVTLTGSLNSSSVPSDGTLDVRDPAGANPCTIDTN